MNIQCVKCKGRKLCGRSFCPIQTKLASQKQSNTKFKQDFFGDTPNVFVGHYGYPNINVGLLATEEYNNHDNPKEWSKENYTIPKIINLRTEMINSNFKTNIKSFKDRFMELSQEVSLSTKPVDMEINLERKPQFKLTLNQDTAPHGPNVKLKKAQITENPKIPHKVDKIVSDYDIKAAGAIDTLYKKGFDEQYLTKIISVGNLGVKTQRILVPTRWSLTAVDDIIGKKLIEKIKTFDTSPYKTFFGGFLGNYYLILMFESEWNYELFETVMGEKISFATDFESYRGRKNYASQTAGGYYACRLAILEKLKQIKKQSGVLALRFINPKEYVAPLGVWVCREATRKSLESKAIEFSSKELMLTYAKHLIKKKFNIDINILLKNSKLLDQIKNQKRLTEF